MDLLAELPKQVEMEIVNEKTNESRVEQVMIYYDIMPKYCKKCMAQGHGYEVCRILHPELKKI